MSKIIFSQTDYIEVFYFTHYIDHLITGGHTVLW